jgi:hypothetical protein
VASYDVFGTITRQHQFFFNHENMSRPHNLTNQVITRTYVGLKIRIAAAQTHFWPKFLAPGGAQDMIGKSVRQKA